MLHQAATNGLHPAAADMDDGADEGLYPGVVVAGGVVLNGTCGETSTAAVVTAPSVRLFSRTDRDVVRLMGQQLRNLGLK